MEDIENILDTLIFDGKVEKTTKGDNAKFYRAIGKSIFYFKISPGNAYYLAKFEFPQLHKEFKEGKR